MSETQGTQSPLAIVPNELDFPPPLNRVITNVLKLQNISNKPVAYKVKTTAPKRYCVRPNTGTILPNDSTEVQVILNGKDQPTDLKSRDKFLVQMLPLNQEASETELKELWARAKEDEIIKQRLKCYFGKSSSSASHAQAPNFLPTIQPQSHDTDSFESEEDRPKRTSQRPQENRSRASEDEMKDASDAPPTPREDPSIVRELEKLRVEHKNITSQLSNVSSQRDELRNELQKMKQLVNNYQQQEKEETFRQRKLSLNSAQSQEKLSNRAQQQQQQLQPQNLPLLLIVVLLIVAFILGYLIK